MSSPPAQPPKPPPPPGTKAPSAPGSQPPSAKPTGAKGPPPPPPGAVPAKGARPAAPPSAKDKGGKPVPPAQGPAPEPAKTEAKTGPMGLVGKDGAEVPAPEPGVSADVAVIDEVTAPGAVPAPALLDFLDRQSEKILADPTGQTAPALTAAAPGPDAAPVPSLDAGQPSTPEVDDRAPQPPEPRSEQAPEDDLKAIVASSGRPAWHWAAVAAPVLVAIALGILWSGGEGDTPRDERPEPGRSKTGASSSSPSSSEQDAPSAPSGPGGTKRASPSPSKTASPSPNPSSSANPSPSPSPSANPSPSPSPTPTPSANPSPSPTPTPSAGPGPTKTAGPSAPGPSSSDAPPPASGAREPGFPAPRVTTSRQPAKAGATEGDQGTLIVSCNRRCTVRLDGAMSSSVTAGGARVRPGRHVVIVTDGQTGYALTLHVDVPAGTTLRKTVAF